MALSIQQNLKQSQNLVLTPELRQAIEVLQLSAVELESFVEEAIASNPLLSKPEDMENSPSNANSLTAEDKSQLDTVKAETEVVIDDMLAGKLGDLNNSDIDHELLWSEDTKTEIKNNSSDENISSLNEITSQNYNDIVTKTSNSNISNGEYDFLKDSLSGEKSTYEEIIDQINLNLDKNKRKIGYKLLEFMDETGKISLTDVESLYSSHNPTKIKGILAELQEKLTPVGIFSTSIVECLELQLKNKNKYDPIIKSFLDNFDLFISGNSKKLKKIMNVNDEDFQSVIDDLKDLTINPLKLINTAPVITVVSDVIVSYNQKKNTWIAELNSQILPKILLNETYYAEVSNDTSDKKVKKFLNDNLKSGNFLLKSLDQRAKHILDISTEILKVQADFFNHGLHRLKPLGMKDIAQACGIHESTVSRIVNNKYMSTPYGVFELRYFFNSALNNTSGDGERSTHVVRERIKSLIAKENSSKPLSDDKIVTILMGEGVNIARRTVAKYRSALNIPSSSKRRYYNNIKL